MRSESTAGALNTPDAVRGTSRSRSQIVEGVQPQLNKGAAPGGAAPFMIMKRGFRGCRLSGQPYLGNTPHKVEADPGYQTTLTSYVRCN